MKKALLFACAFISFATISQAQIKKGSVLLGGNFGFSKDKSESGTVENKGNSFHVSPAVGIAFKDNWVVGINTGFWQSRSKPATPSNNYEVNSYSGGIFVRRYSHLGKNFYLYGNAATGYSTYNRKEAFGTDNTRKYETKSVSLTVSPGLAYAVSNRFHLEVYLNDLLTLGYTATESVDSGIGGVFTSKGKGFNLGTNLNTTAPLSLGFRFVLGK